MPVDSLPSSTEVNALADRLAVDMRRRWKEGDQVQTEEFVAAHPELADHPGAVGELIYEEVTLRRERGESGGSTEVLRRFPQWAPQLRVMLDLRDALEAEGLAAFPEPGEWVGEFELIGELGRGARGRVFLARQPALADRPVVVKLIPRADAEHLCLARLQHTHIVPLYAAHEDPTRGLRILCMPYFGGTTLAQAMSRLGSIAPADRTPEELWAAVAGPSTQCRAADDYVRLIVRMAAGLADALQFAHDHGLIHMDVKPSNVLLTADGQPMLLDFHLARAPLTAGDPPPAWMGGTAAYAAPEQLAALDAVRSARPVLAPVDGRADLYALGVVVHEALAGRLPDPGVPLSICNRRVSIGLSDVVARCLATDPADRYSDAAALADDLRRHLADQPLRGARNRSLAERWRKWRRRRPHALGVIGVLVLALAAIGLGAGYVGHRLTAARSALDEGNAELTRGRTAEARGAFRRGIAVAADLPIRGDLLAELTSGLRRADRAAAADDLHLVAEGMRALSVAEVIAPADRARAASLGGQLWGRRVDVFALAARDLPLAVRERARADLLDVVLVWSHLRAEDAPAERLAIIDVLTESERALGPCAGLYRERAALARDLGRAADAAADLRRAEDSPPTSAFDHAALGGHLLRRGEPEAARAEFEIAATLDPHSFWARLALGRCDATLGRPDDALRSFAVCVGLEPANPLGYLHEAHTHARLGRRDKALAEVDRALSLDPNNSQARALRDALVGGD